MHHFIFNYQLDVQMTNTIWPFCKMSASKYTYALSLDERMQDFKTKFLTQDYNRKHSPMMRWTI